MWSERYRNKQSWLYNKLTKAPQSDIGADWPVCFNVHMTTHPLDYGDLVNAPYDVFAVAYAYAWTKFSWMVSSLLYFTECGISIMHELEHVSDLFWAWA